VSRSIRRRRFLFFPIRTRKLLFLLVFVLSRGAPGQKKNQKKPEKTRKPEKPDLILKCYKFWGSANLKAL